MTPPSSPWTARLAALALLLMAVVVAASAWLRLTLPSRPACERWPQCRFVQDEAVPVAAPSAPSRDATAAVRAAHRAAASAALLVIVLLLVMAWRQRDRMARRLAGVLLALALGLSALGIVAPGSRAAPVMLGNLLGGATMFALAWVLWRHARGALPMPSPLRRAALALALPWVAQAALGALSGAALGWGATLLHLLLALLLPIAGLSLVLAAQRAGREREAGALLAVLALQVVLGVGAALGATSAAVVVAHNLSAAAGLALLLGWWLTAAAAPAA